jgi:hypothetical protein
MEIAGTQVFINGDNPMSTLKKRVPLFSMCLALLPAGYAVGDEMGDRRPIITEMLVSPEQVARPFAVQQVVMAGDTVSGVVVNNSRHVMRDVELLIRYGWLWENEFSPGENEPGRAIFYRLPDEIPPGASVPFAYRPELPLPLRTDGRYVPSVEVVGFTRFEEFAED